jgi:KDO2-lipid IV(A) lauroyltransferase
MSLVFKLFSALPLWLLHGVGGLLGWIAFLGSSAYRRRFLDNAGLAGVASRQWLRAVAESGKLVVELPRLWLGRAVPIAWSGHEHIDAALWQGKGVVFLTPHLGCFEVAAQAYAKRYGTAGHPITVLYRPPRQPWLRRWVESSRARPGLETAPTTLAGVKQLIKALKRGDCVGLLPDQVPPQGQGVWLPFFGREAYTMTLSARLALQTGSVVLVTWGERLSWGRGYRVHVEPLGVALAADIPGVMGQINRAMEDTVRKLPGQYLWGYARYKQPRSVAVPGDA